MKVRVRPMWRRRLFAAVLAVVVVALVTLFDATRSDAAPSRAPDDQCTVEQWQNPFNFTNCTSRLRDAVCLSAPTPDDPDDGAAGLFTDRPDSDYTSGITGRYSTYGVAGYQLSLYDTSCSTAVAHPEFKAESAVASALFTAAATVVGGANGLREHAYRPGSVWGFMDGFVGSATSRVYEYLFTPAGGIALAIVGLWLIYMSFRGSLSGAMRVAAWAAFAMVALTVVCQYPVASVHAADRVAAGGLSAVHSVTGPGPQDADPGNCFNPDPAACVDHRSASTRASDAVVDATLYRNWLMATFGSPDSVTAKKYGPALFDAGTLSWAESADLQAHPETRRAVLDAKAQRWNRIAAQIQHDDPVAYGHLQGLHGMDRVMAGALALLSALAFAMFDVSASLVILFGFLIFRVAVMNAPILGIAGLFEPTSGPLRWMGRMVATSAMNIVVFGGSAGLYLSASVAIFQSGMGTPLQFVAVVLAGVASFALLRPVRRLRLSAGSGVDPSAPGGGVIGWARRRGPAVVSFVNDAAAEARRPAGAHAKAGARS